MNSLLRNWLAQVESWEAAAEFGIPRDEWAQYDIIQRIDDVYIASLSAVFDALRIADSPSRQSELWSLAKTLLVYSRGAAVRYLSGVQRDLNQLYAAALFYIAGYPATATFLARNLSDFSTEIEEEMFMRAFLCRDASAGDTLSRQLALFIDGQTEDISGLMSLLSERIDAGILCNPRQFIAAKLDRECIVRFSTANVWKLLREHAEGYSMNAWRPFFTAGQSATMWELLPSQQIALTQGLMNRMETTFSLQMPTSAGKTALCELLIYHEVKIHGRFVLFLVPFRALAAEIQRGMTKRLSGIGIRIVATHGGNIPTRSESTSVVDAEVLIVTPEKFATLEQMAKGLSERFKTIICDEGHLIDDKSRGLGYELLLTRLRSSNVPGRRFIFLSAVIPNVSDINAWLGGDERTLVQSEYRPVDTDYCFIRRISNDSYRLDVNPTEAQPRNYFLHHFLIPDDFRYTNPVTGRQKLIDGGRSSFTSLACAAALKARRTGPVALFTTTRGGQGTQALGKAILNMVKKGIRAAQDGPNEAPGLPELLEFILFLLGDEHLLTQLVGIGIGYHHGRLPQEIRRAIEEGVQEGSINIIICTNTLAEGVNLPIRTMVVHTVRRYDPDRVSLAYIQNRSIKNIIGRAGRAGKETRGRIIFVNWNERVRIEQVLREQEIEPAKGLLCRLIETLHEFSIKNQQDLTNELFERQEPWFLAIIDKIDISLLNLVSSEAQAGELEQYLTGLLEQTLARRLCTSMELRHCLETVFRLRAEYLAATVEQATWLKIRKSGTAPRFWRFISERMLLGHPLWFDLRDHLDDRWLQEVILPLLDYGIAGVSCDRGILLEFIRGWLSGLTYQELAENCGCDVDKILDIVCNDVGYVLQDLVSKLCQLAIETHDEGTLSELARNWSSLLQYGLGSLQQLDLFERGVSDRLAVWGVARYIEATQTALRGQDLIAHLRRNRVALRSSLERDNRVPAMSVKRFIRELRIQ